MSLTYLHIFIKFSSNADFLTSIHSINKIFKFERNLGNLIWHLVATAQISKVKIFFEKYFELIEFFHYLFIYFYRYLQLRVECTQPILSRAFQANITTTKTQTGNVLSVSGIWKHWAVSNAIRCSPPTDYYNL